MSTLIFTIFCCTLFLQDVSETNRVADTPAISIRDKLRNSLKRDFAEEPRFTDVFESVVPADVPNQEQASAILLRSKSSANIVRFLNSINSPMGIERVTASKLLTESGLDAFARTQLSLHIAQELSTYGFMPEGAEFLDQCDPTLVVDPAVYWFARGTIDHALSRTESASNALSQLEKLRIPKRYDVLARELRSTLAGLQKSPLKGIAHDMRDVRHRLERGGIQEPVQKIENDIIARLDKLIKDLEDQENKANQSQGGGSKQNPGQPADRSQPLGGGGPGKVDRKAFKDNSPWGKLPEKDREKAIQDIGRTYPDHYREAIEEYFRRLATTDETPAARKP